MIHPGPACYSTAEQAVEAAVKVFPCTGMPPAVVEEWMGLYDLTYFHHSRTAMLAAQAAQTVRTDRPNSSYTLPCPTVREQALPVPLASLTCDRQLLDPSAALPAKRQCRRGCVAYACLAKKPVAHRYKVAGQVYSGCAVA